MEISVSQETARVPVTRFSISGPFNADEPLASMAKQAYDEGARDMLIDMTDVPYMSSAGLRALHSIYTLLRDQTEGKKAVSQGLREGSYHSPHLKILKPSKLVDEVLRLAGYDMFIQTHANLKDALDSF